MRLIDADALKSFYGSWSGKNTEFTKPEVDRFVDLQITIDAEPVKHGRNESGCGFLCSVCSFGDFGLFRDYRPKFCPNCGAKMDG